MQAVHEIHAIYVYAKKLKRFYGRTVKGIFTDEPSTCHSMVGELGALGDAEAAEGVCTGPRVSTEHGDGGTVPTTWGPETAKIRCDFSRTVLRLVRGQLLWADIRPLRATRDIVDRTPGLRRGAKEQLQGAVGFLLGDEEDALRGSGHAEQRVFCGLEDRAVPEPGEARRWRARRRTCWNERE